MRLDGIRADVLRFGLGARNWILSQIPEDVDIDSLPSPEKGRSAGEIMDHIVWVITAACGIIAEEAEIELGELELRESTGSSHKDEVYAAYDLFRTLCESISEEMLDVEINIPPPARVRRGTVERVLRIMAGYHVVHHAGQIAYLLGRTND